jgi:hypothetical protein
MGTLPAHGEGMKGRLAHGALWLAHLVTTVLMLSFGALPLAMWWAALPSLWRQLVLGGGEG